MADFTPGSHDWRKVWDQLWESLDEFQGRGTLVCVCGSLANETGCFGWVISQTHDYQGGHCQLKRGKIKSPLCLLKFKSQVTQLLRKACVRNLQRKSGPTGCHVQCVLAALFNLVFQSRLTGLTFPNADHFHKRPSYCLALSVALLRFSPWRELLLDRPGGTRVRVSCLCVAD